MENSSRLYRSQKDKIIGGVSGGLADYFNIDVALVRIAFVLLLLFGGGGFLAYVILWIVIPMRPINFTKAGNTEEGDDIKDESTKNSENSKSIQNKKNNTSLIAGLVLILVGLLILVDRIMPFYNIIDFWPLILIIIGALMIKPELFKSMDSKNDKETIVINETTDDNK